MTVQQSKLESHIEASANIASGFIISFLVWIWFVGPLVGAGYLNPLSALDAFIITAIFTITSYIRSYVWRRFFNAGFHKAVHGWVTRR